MVIISQSIVDQIESLHIKQDSQTIQKTCKGIKDIFNKVVKMAKDYDNCLIKFVTLNGELKNVIDYLRAYSLLEQLKKKINDNPDLKFMTGNRREMIGDLDYIIQKLPRLAVDGIVCYTDIVRESTEIRSYIEKILKNAQIRNV